MSGPVFASEGAVWLDTLKFDFGRVMQAAEEVVMTLIAEFGGSCRLMIEDGDVCHESAWPEPGLAVERTVWRNAAGVYEVADVGLIHCVGEVSVKAFLLGKTWCVYDPAGGALKTPTGGAVSELDPTPLVCVYGRRLDLNAYALPFVETIRKVEGLLTGRLASLGLEMAKSQEMTYPSDDRVRQVGYIRFPHARYGRGSGLVRVRCVTAAGGEVSPRAGSN